MRIGVCIYNTVQSEKKSRVIYLFYRAGDILRAPSFFVVVFGVSASAVCYNIVEYIGEICDTNLCTVFMSECSLGLAELKIDFQLREERRKEINISAQKTNV